MDESAYQPESLPSHRVIVMGVSGCGKSTVGEAISDQLGVAYLDGDDHHPQANIDKMSRGEALDDADRRGWLDTLAAIIGQHRSTEQSLMIGCSALKRSYREQLRAADPDLMFLFLDGSFDVIRQRMEQRSHFFSPDMLRTQFATLEAPARDEAIRVDIDGDWNAVVAHSVAALATLFGRQPAT